MARAPRLSHGTDRSKVNQVEDRLNALIPTTTSELSPVKIYTPAADIEVQKAGDVAGASDYGWTCPDGVTTVQVECFGAGGGGGGGAVSAVGGGGGGGGGEYACEPDYPVVPGTTYSWFAGDGGMAGNSSPSGSVPGDTMQPGSDGPDTHFDFRGVGRDGGVIASGGQGGDFQGIGTGGAGGTGSPNTIHFDGGSGGTSSAGIMSDNPVIGRVNGAVNTLLSYRLDDTDTSANDFSASKLNSISLLKNTGAIAGPQNAVQAPAQTPYGPGTTTQYSGGVAPGEAQGYCWQFAHGTGSGYIGGIVAPSFTSTYNLTTFTVSAWVKGDPAAAGAGDWTDGSHTSAVVFGNKDVSSTTSVGWCFFLGGLGSTQPPTLNFLVGKDTSHQQTVTCPGPAANDGNWHMITATYSIAANQIILYIDGVAQTTVAPTTSALGTASQRPTIGINYNTNAFGFKGYMSNVWISKDVASGSYISAAYGATAASGGSGGGGSAGSAGGGNTGTAAVGTAGGAGGASQAASSPGINNGAGAGGAGGASGNAGSTPAYTAPYAGGGGGAGAATAPARSYTSYLTCSMSGSYTGYDAQGGQALGQLYTVSADPAVSETNPWYSVSAHQDSACYSGGRADSAFNGSMFSVLTFPSLADTAGGTGSPFHALSDSGFWTVDRVYLQLTINTPNACNLVIGSWNSNEILSAIPDDATLAAFGYGGALYTEYVEAGDAGRQVTLDVTSSWLISNLTGLASANGYGGRGCGLLVGALNGSATYQGNVHGAWNEDEAQDWYCSFTGAGDAVLKVKHHAAGGTKLAAGAGNPGYIVVSFIDPNGSPVATVLPAAAADTAGNALAAGYTADAPNYRVWQPGSSPRTLEGWHNMTLLNGWSLGTGGYAQYKLMPGNIVALRGANVAAGTTAANTSLWTPPAGYVPVATSGFRIPLPVIIEVTGATPSASTPKMDVSAFTPASGFTTTGAGLYILNWPASTTRIGFNTSYALD